MIALRSEDNIDILDKTFPFKYEIISGEKLDLSSSTFRNKLKEKTIKVCDLPSEILTYAKENSLYWNFFLISWISESNPSSFSNSSSSNDLSFSISDSNSSSFSKTSSLVWWST